jgi:hypothetical protein
MSYREPTQARRRQRAWLRSGCCEQISVCKRGRARPSVTSPSGESPGGLQHQTLVGRSLAAHLWINRGAAEPAARAIATEKMKTLEAQPSRTTRRMGPFERLEAGRRKRGGPPGPAMLGWFVGGQDPVNPEVGLVPESASPWVPGFGGREPMELADPSGKLDPLSHRLCVLHPGRHRCDEVRRLLGPRAELARRVAVSGSAAPVRHPAARHRRARRRRAVLRARRTTGRHPGPHGAGPRAPAQQPKQDPATIESPAPAAIRSQS